MTYALAHVNGLLHTFQRPDSASHWKNPPANQPLSGQKPPLTGTITPLTRLPADKFPQSLEENARKSTSQRAKTSTHWNNHPTNTASSGQIPPVTGRKCPQINFSAGRFLHRLEENGQNHTLQVSRFLQRVEETARRRDTLILHAHIRRGRYSGTRNSRHANSIRRIQSPLAGAAVLCRYP